VRIKNVILNNFGMKLLSLVLAAIVWMYIVGELNRLALEEEMGLKGHHLVYEITAKVLPVVVDLKGELASGYRIDSERIEISPPVCNVMGPRRLLAKLEFIKTAPIDITEYRKPVTMRVALKLPSRGIKIIDKFITVVIPIEKIRQQRSEN